MCWINSCVVGTLLLLGSTSYAAPKWLLRDPVPSPSRELRANVEWDDAGFIGLIRMNIHAPSGRFLRRAELPEINPSPADLYWLDNDWVACQSYIGSHGSGLFYVHAHTMRAYLMEVVATDAAKSWMFTFTTNDGVSSASIIAASESHSSVFPISLRNAPEEEGEYFRAEFAETLAQQVDAFSDWRRAQKFRDIVILGPHAAREGVGAVVAALIDNKPTVVYFPMTTTSTAEMLSRTRLMPMDERARQILNSPTAPRRVYTRWTDGDGRFVVEARASAGDGTSTTPAVAAAAAKSAGATTITLFSGQFAGVSDIPTTPTIVTPVTTTTVSLPATATPVAESKLAPAAATPQPKATPTGSRKKLSVTDAKKPAPKSAATSANRSKLSRKIPAAAPSKKSRSSKR